MRSVYSAHVPSLPALTRFSEKDFLHTLPPSTFLLRSFPNGNLAIAVFSRFPMTNNFPWWWEMGKDFLHYWTRIFFLPRKKKTNRDQQLWQQKEKCLKINNLFLTDSAAQIAELLSTTSRDKTKKTVNNYAKLQSNKTSTLWQREDRQRRTEDSARGSVWKEGRDTLIRNLAEENLKVRKNEMDKFSPWNEKRRALPIT